ncbi:hypothetical protein ACRALDRAFT_1077329 [Sodiomyces alcalophilus JCM 7366]|uniref:uncharacterized protein n=1 Tax=Sodiomyces alcalophilus JCM 7366 TaxID=591952 RepID=UPI0039B46209
MASDPNGHSSPVPSATASSLTPSAAESTGRKRGAPSEDRSPAAAGSEGSPAASGAGSPANTTASAATTNASKKRRTGPGSRGVASLTPAQLAKKRANDREAQRAIRERTKNQIEQLERRIRELTSQQPYQELQVALRAKEAVEAENAEIKRQLASIVSVLQPLISSPHGQAPTAAAHDPVHAFPTSRFVSGPHHQHHHHPPHSAAPVSTHTASTPGSAASPGPAEHQPWPAVSNDQLAQEKMLNQQRHDLRHNLDLGPEKLGLEFILDSSRRFPRVQSGIHGAQDSPQYHHIPMKHDWASAYAAQHPAIAYANASFHQTRPDHGSESTSAAVSRGTPVLAPAPTTTPTTTTPTPAPAPASTAPSTAYSTTELRNCAPTCPLDSLLLDFLNERRQRAADGLPTRELIGPRYPSVSSLLNPANSQYSHPLSKVFTDILSTFPDLSRLPEKVAVLYIMFLIMRWQIAPTRENLERLPSWAAPVPEQFIYPHPAWVDHLPFPLMRKHLARNYNIRDYPFDEFFIPFTTTLSLNWPYEEVDTLLMVPGSDDVMINPVFERHLRRLENWTLGDSFASALPGLNGMYNFKSSSSQTDR